MDPEITYKISDFLERVFSLTKEELLRPSSRVIWMDHVERLKKDEGVYWLLSFKKEFVFDLATQNGLFYLIRNYKSTDNNIVSIDLSKVPNVPCIIEVAWDVDFIELTINVEKNILPENKKGFKSRLKTESWNPPIELFHWIDQQNQIEFNTYPSEEDFRRRLIEIIKGLQRNIDTNSTLKEFWETKGIEPNNKNPLPKSIESILPIILENITKELNLASIKFSYEINPKSGAAFLSFSTQIANKGISTIELEIFYAHSNDIINEISKEFPYHIKTKNSRYGIFLVLWFKGEWINLPMYDSEESLQYEMQKSLYQANHDKSVYNNNITISILDLSSDTKQIGHLKIANCSSLRFEQKDKKLIATYNNRKIVFGTSLMILKRNKDLTAQQKLRLGSDNLRAYCAQNKLPLPVLKNSSPVYSKDIVNDYTPFYKYVKPCISEKIKNGSWQLGTIEQYRTIENKKQRDEFEGYSFLYLDINNRMIGSNFISGFNYLILCGTRSSNSDYHKENFGKKILFFRDVKSLAEKICVEIKAKQYYIQNIEYNSLKFYVSNEKIFNKYLQLENLLSPPFFDIVFDQMLYPCVFVKPESFKPENEVRLVFEMDQDFYNPYKFSNKDITKYIEFL